MNAQMDLRFGRELKEGGRLKAASNPRRNMLLHEAQATARRIAYGRISRSVTADDVANEFQRRGLDYEQLGPAAGSLFKGGEWEFTGKWVESARPVRHAGANRVWRLK